MRRSILTILTLGTVLAAGGCERNHEVVMGTPTPRMMRMATADPTYRLNAEERNKVLPGFDADALERLLSVVPPDARQGLMRHFQQRDKGENLGVLVEMSDPRLQPLLEEVWAPMWDEIGATDEQLEGNHFGYPGRQIAKDRRAARANARINHP